ncbi:hypothetical protein N7G274_006230 [Stereocaulon virgatum]|uniref:RNase III domain-containing protein n=1 Tax=Stereocaulon virgatum TaxID=373712 RepID=A0ABR4A8Q0_9LECA
MTSDEKASAIRAVETLIQYKFHKTDLLWEALQTSKMSALSTNARLLPEGNRRLAIVGDAAMQLALAEDWYRTSDTRGQFSNIIRNVGSNANLNRIGLGLGLERFIVGPIGGKAIADTVEAILGAIYLDSDFAQLKKVMDALDLNTEDVRLERQLDLEGFIILDNEAEEEPNGRRKKRQRTDIL